MAYGSLVGALNEDAYFMRRLGFTRRMSSLPASVQLDLARSPIDDAQLEEISRSFGHEPGDGWGFSKVAEQLLSAEPRTAAVNDVTALQEKLQGQGYLPPYYQATGVWDDQSQVALRQLDRDNFELQRSGKGFLAAPVEAGVRMITNTLPSQVWQGIVGTAKGIIAQTPETLERVGVLGGAAGGAVIGTAILPGVGTAVGAGAGAVLGFLGDLFGEEEDEEGQGTLANIADALTPFEEYSSSPRAFFEDLGYVFSAASLIGGAKLAGAGVMKGVSALGGVRAAQPALTPLRALTTPSPDLAAGVMARATADVLPGTIGYTNRMLQLVRANKMFIGGGAAIGSLEGVLEGDLEQALKGAAVGAGFGLATGAVFGGKVGQKVLTTPIFQMANGAYTGLSAGQLGSRLAAGIGSGEYETTIERAIRTTEPLKTGVEVPLFGDLVDWSAFLLYPAQWFPWKGRQLSKGATAMMGDTRLRPLAHLSQRGRNIGLRKAVYEVRDTFSGADGPAFYTKLWLDYGVELRAHQILDELGPSAHVGVTARRIKAQLRRQMLDESVEGPSKLAGEVLAEALKNEHGFEAWMTIQWGRGNGLDAMKNYREVTMGARDIEARLRREGALVEEMVGTRATKKKGDVVVADDVIRIDPGFAQEGWATNAVRDIQRQVRQLEDQKKKAERALKRTTDQYTVTKNRVAIDELDAKISRLKEQADEIAKSATRRRRSMEELHIVPARKDTPTAATYRGWRREFKQLRSNLTKASKAEGGEAAAAYQQARFEFEDFVQNLHRRSIITDEARNAALSKPKPGNEIEKFLEAQASVAARDVKLPDTDMAFFDKRGFKPVVTGDEIFLPDQVRQMVNLLEVPNYTRRAALWETIGFSPRFATDDGQNSIRWANTVAELERVFREADDGAGIPMSGEQAIRRLEKHLQQTNPDAVLQIPVVGTIGAALKHRTDIRQVKPEEIANAFSDVIGFTDDVAMATYRAIRRGAAFGHDIELRHPIVAARTIGRANRTAGLPGFSDVIRGWHAKDPRSLTMTRLRDPDYTYNPPRHLRQSENRTRFVTQLREAGAKAQLTRRDVAVSEMVFDVAAEAAVAARPELYGTVDAFYRRIGAGFEPAYREELGGLLQLRFSPKAPTTNRLMSMARKFTDSADWYTKSHEALVDTFAFGTSTLRDGRTIADWDLFRNLLAASSPMHNPVENMADALKAIAAFKSGQAIPKATGPAGSTISKMWDEILNGHTIDRWEGKARPKVRNFYENLKGNGDVVTVDTWMVRLFKGRDKPNAGEFEEIAEKVTALSRRLGGPEAGWSPAATQAALWVAFKDEVATVYEKMRRDAIASGDTKLAGDIGKEIRRMRDATDFAGAMKLPKIQELLETYRGTLGDRLLQKVDDNVRGAIAFGDDHAAMIRLFSTGGFDTLVHEGGHLMRRILPPTVVQEVERAYGVTRPTSAFDNAPTRPLIEVTDDHLDDIIRRTLDLKTRGGGGASFDPHTGEFATGRGYAVATRYGTADTISAEVAKNDPEFFRAKLREFIENNREPLASERAYVGLWNDRKGTIHIDVSEILADRAQALEVAAVRGQNAAYDLKQLKDLPIGQVLRDRFGPGAWPVSAEERFANEFTAYIMGKLTPGTPFMRHLKEAVGFLWGRSRELADSGIIAPGTRRELDKMFGDQLSRAGIRPTPSAIVSRQTIGGAALGAAEGALVGDDAEDIARGALFGAGLGLGLRGANRMTYGYLPDSLARLNTTLRYTLSITFDAGRYTEQNLIAATKYGIPFIWSPRKHIMKQEWKTPYGGGKVTGNTAWTHVQNFWDELNGTSYFTRMDELDRRLFQVGMLGFSPRNFEAAQAWYLYQRGWDKDKIRDAVLEIGRYGVGRTLAERSVNFVFFPFSFQKKLLTTLGDFVLQSPGRNLLIHEGLRRYHDSTLDDKFHEVVERHAPLLEQLWLVNNLAFGLSLGRFAFEGLADRRTGVGQAAQIMASFFVPSGAATPLQKAVGAMGDLSVQAFVPVVITGESIDRAGGIDGLDDILKRYVPMVREISTYAEKLNEQKVALLSPKHLAPWSQVQEYMEGLRDAEQDLQPMALALGYESVDGLLASDVGAFAQAQLDRTKEELRTQYPQGWELTTRFENEDMIDAAGLIDLGRKVNKTAGEEAFLEIIQSQQALATFSDMGLIPEDFSRVIEQEAVRSAAMKWVNDRRFVELYRRFLEPTYGPIVMVA